MRRSTRLAEKASTENVAQIGPKIKKNRLDDKTSEIAILDNGTMVEAFKFLNYCQLAKKSLVSKRFRNVIQTHRHSLALLYVNYIGNNKFCDDPTGISMFGKELSPEDYNEWVNCNNYSKQIPGKESTDSLRRVYFFLATVKDTNLQPYVETNKTTVFSARTKLTHENWPLFQHFVRLLADPFVYIIIMKFIPLKELLILLTEEIKQGRIQCEDLWYNFNGKNKKFWNWTNAHVRCDLF